MLRNARCRKTTAKWDGVSRAMEQTGSGFSPDGALRLYGGQIRAASLKVFAFSAEGDKVLSVWESGGTQTGPLASSRGTIPPSGNRGVVRGMTLNRLEDGLIIEAWDNFDLLGMLMQLGVIPSGGPPANGGGPNEG